MMGWGSGKGFWVEVIAEIVSVHEERVSKRSFQNKFDAQSLRKSRKVSRRSHGLCCRHRLIA